MSSDGGSGGGGGESIADVEAQFSEAGMGGDVGGPGYDGPAFGVNEFANFGLADESERGRVGATVDPLGQDPNMFESLFGVNIRDTVDRQTGQIGTVADLNFSPLSFGAGLIGGPLATLGVNGITSITGDPTHMSGTIGLPTGDPTAGDENRGYEGRGGERPIERRPYLLSSAAPVTEPAAVGAPVPLTPYEHLKQKWAGNQFLLAPIRRQS